MSDAAATVSEDEPQAQYFAKKTGPDFIAGARQCERNWLYTAQTNGLWRLWWLIYCQVLGIDPGTGEQNGNQQLKVVGDEARYIQFRVQLTRVLIQQKIMLAQDERPSFEGVASNNNAASLAKVNMASKAIEYVLTESKLEQRASGGLEANGYFGAGGLHLSWDYGGGRMVDVQEPQIGVDGEPVSMPDLDPETQEPRPELDAQGQPVLDEMGAPKPKLVPQMQTVKKRSGAPKIDKLYPWQQVVDPYQEDDHSWVIIKLPVNKHDLAAQFPEKAKQILALTIDAEMGDDALFAWGNKANISSDIVVLRILYHRDCEAVPGGRMAQWCQEVGLVGCDEIMPCPLEQGLPWEPIIAGKYFCTAFGYPESSDLLAVQSALNETVSQTLTLVQKHGNANLWKRDDVVVDEAAYQAGGAMFDLPPGAPIPEVTKFDDMGEAPRFIVEFCREVMPLMMGLNPTVQGQPESNITSGAFGVLLVNLAQKFASQMQQGYDFALTGIANKGLELVKKNASNGFWAEVAGVADTPYFELFKTEDLEDFHSVKMVRRNPVMSTLMGRMEIYNSTKDLPKKDRAEAMELLLDSRTDAYAENDQSATIRMRKENEQMLTCDKTRPAGLELDPMAYQQWLKSIAPKVSWSDPHPMEIAKHNAERDKMRSQDPPKDPAKYQLWTDTINLLDAHSVDHCNTWASTPLPMLLGAGIPPIESLMGAPPGGGAAGGGGPPKPGGAGPNAKTPSAGSNAGAPASPQGPSTPKPPGAAEGAAAGSNA